MSRRFPAPHLGAIGTRVVLDAATSHHLLTVCLVPRGELLRVFHGGWECEARLVDGSGGVAVLELVGEATPVRAGDPRVLLLALTRKPAWERALRMVTELGATDIHPFHARHGVAKGVHLDRWRRIVEEAARQCERGIAPEVHAPRPLPELVSMGPGLVLSPGAPIAAATEGSLTLLIGPEGGLHAEEVEIAVAAGFVAAGLGRTVLRADTAAVAALARYGLSSSSRSGPGWRPNR